MADPDEIEFLDIDLDWHAPQTATGATSPGGGRRVPGWLRPDPRWLILVAVVLYIGWLVRFNGGDESAEPGPELDVPTTTLSPSETVSVDDDRLELAGDPSLDLAAAIDAIDTAILNTSYLEMQVNPDGVDVFAVVKRFNSIPGGYRFGYLGVDGFPIVIDSGGGTIRSLTSERAMRGDSGFAVLNDSDGVVGLDVAQPDVAVRVATEVSVVRRYTGELFGVEETADGIAYGLVDDRDSWEVLPGGADFWIEPAVGVFVTPVSGGVFELTPDGVESVTPFEMIATNGTRWIEIRRVVGPDEYWVVDRSGAEWPLDRELLDVGPDLSISPDGQWVFIANGLVDRAFPAFYGVETGEIIEVESRADRHTPVWAPDSSFVAELDATRNCVWINFLTGLNGCIVLDRLNVPALEASALVVY